MTLIADTHVHLYDGYDRRLALDRLVSNLCAHVAAFERGCGTGFQPVSRAASGHEDTGKLPAPRGDTGPAPFPGRVETPRQRAQAAAFLTDRAGGTVFEQVRAGDWTGAPSAVNVVPLPGDGVLALESAAGQRVHLFAGRQIVTQERLEVLGLALQEDLPDGAPARDIIARVRELGGVPVLSWAPGKWFLGRGRLVRQLVREASAGELLLGDTSLRPPVWPTPRPMRRGALLVVAGSDPLPFPGEEQILGTYACRLDGAIDASDPLGSMRRVLTAPGARAVPVGRRSGVIAMLDRLRRNHAVRRGDARAGG